MKLTTIVQWFQTHPLLVSIILFGVGCVVSIYSGDIRQFLHEYPKKKLREFSLERAKDRLRLLNTIHDSAYQLNLWLYAEILNALFVAFALQLVSSVIVFALHRGFSLPPFYWNGVIGVFTGSWLRIREILSQLRNYPVSARELLEQVSKLGGFEVSAPANTSIVPKS